jgi:hypothetical protein
MGWSMPPTRGRRASDLKETQPALPRAVPAAAMDSGIRRKRRQKLVVEEVVAPRSRKRDPRREED